MDYEGYFADDEATFITEIRSIVHSTVSYHGRV